MLRLKKFLNESTYRLFSQTLRSDRISLDFSDLTPYEIIRDQYQQWGIQFEGAIALYPTNPAFITSPNTLIVLPTSHQPVISVHFHHSKQIAGAVITAAHEVKLSVFNQDHQLLAEQKAGIPHYLQSYSGAIKPLPQHHLELIAEHIIKAEFSSHSPFILHNFFCD
ncbi:MAG: hypothetical protein HC769_19975 [Cyanobacteria bacterium CRU_2_1]|nr:hypothetical protein [Cyanobacteria bacterium RU_5_0]NJR60897.1 hypothetical protein [Cyanobacteria bacterium CRU_2_1]